MRYYVYMIRCSDNSLYTGITNNIDKRMSEHFNQKKECAKYTKSHKVVSIESIWTSKDKSSAAKLEYYIKSLSKKEKEDIVINNNLSKYLKGKIDCRKYRRINE